MLQYLVSFTRSTGTSFRFSDVDQYPIRVSRCFAANRKYLWTEPVQWSPRRLIITLERKFTNEKKIVPHCGFSFVCSKYSSERLRIDEGQALRGGRLCSLNELSNKTDYPFNKVWVKAGVDWDKYKTIYIKNVNTKYLMEATWWQRSFRREDMEADTRNIALYMQNKFRESFKNDPRRLYRVLDSPKPGSLTLELAITELAPSNPVLEAVSIAAPYGSGVVVQAAAKESGAKATVAFEARLVDTDTGMVLVMLADREQGKVAPINLRASPGTGKPT